jgi:hypothetical protein
MGAQGSVSAMRNGARIFQISERFGLLVVSFHCPAG